MQYSGLPPEIVLIVLDCISTTPVLKSFCLLSKKFCAIAQALLYHEIRLGPEGMLLSLLLHLITALDLKIGPVNSACL